MIRALFFGLLLAGPSVSHAAMESPAGLFANAHDVFPPLRADPREIQFVVRFVSPVRHTPQGEVSAGNYFGLYRWTLPWAASYLQWSAGGGDAARFDLVSITKDLQVNDFNASMPIDLRIGPWSTRLLPYHVSSHLGDDYIKRTGIVRDKYSFDSFKWFVAYDAPHHLRLYEGYHYIIRNESADRGHHAFQAGAEWQSGWWGSGHAQTYWATDIQSWERVAWNISVNSQLGIRVAHQPEERQSLDPFIEFSSGPRTAGQFYDHKETRWVLGLRFELP